MRVLGSHQQQHTQTKQVEARPRPGGRARWTLAGPRRGIVSVIVAVCSVAIMGMLGLATDLGRMYIAKNELQNYADASSLAAALRLDGTQAGIASAKTKATSDTNRWAFGTQTVPNLTVQFATAVDGPYQSNPANASGYRFVRVEALSPVPIYFMRLFPGVGATSPVRAASISGQTPMTSIGDTIVPFSPDAHDPNDPTGNYGFLLGRYYTLRYDNKTGNQPPGTYLVSLNGIELIGCEADMTKPGFRPGETSNSQRGYIDLTDLSPIDAGGGSNLIKDLIRSRTSFQNSITPFQYWVKPEPGEKQVTVSTLQERVQNDTDPLTPKYYTQPQTGSNNPPLEVMNSTYRSAYAIDEPRPPFGNGRRIIRVPVNDPKNSSIVIGFAGFFLPPDPCKEVNIAGKKYYPCCGEYIGPTTFNGGSAAGSGGGAFRVGLIR